MQTQTVTVPVTPAAKNETQRLQIWPAAIILFGLALNVAWVALLGYGIIRILKLAY